MQIDSIEYKGFIIKPRPYRIADSQKWRTQIAVYLVDYELHIWNFTDATSTFDHEEEAFENGFEFGRRIIDNKKKGIPVQSF